jgi:hypothetical protein
MHQYVDAIKWHYYLAHYWDYASDIIRHIYYNYMHSYASHIVLTHYILLTSLPHLKHHIVYYYLTIIAQYSNGINARAYIPVRLCSYKSQHRESSIILRLKLREESYKRVEK